jgi:hypothetical protein
MIAGLRKEIISNFFYRFSVGLYAYNKHYLSLIFKDSSLVPKHAAYVCPLCIKHFIVIGPSGETGWSSEFSLDHFPPESVGGFQTALVCKECNNNAGKDYDFSLQQKMDRMSFDNKIPNSKIKIKSVISDVTGRYPGFFSIRDDGEIEAVLKPNLKMHSPFLDNWIHSSKENMDWEATITIPIPDETKISNALLKTAYLFCFDKWGYEFAYSIGAEKIRNVLKNSDSYPAKIPFSWVIESIKENNINSFPLGVCEIQKPTDCKSFVVNILLVNKETNYKEIACILMPNPEDTCWDRLSAVQNILNDNTKIEVSMDHVKEGGYKHSWERLLANT